MMSTKGIVPPGCASESAMAGRIMFEVLAGSGMGLLVVVGTAPMT